LEGRICNGNVKSSVDICDRFTEFNVGFAFEVNTYRKRTEQCIYFFKDLVENIVFIVTHSYRVKSGFSDQYGFPDIENFDTSES
jgi:hypothetical protein